MKFVYLHAVAFAAWMLFLEKSPWPTLTLIVSLEAIFLSTFVMIGQNTQASYQQAKADHDFVASEQELHANTELTRLISTSSPPRSTRMSCLLTHLRQQAPLSTRLPDTAQGGPRSRPQVHVHRSGVWGACSVLTGSSLPGVSA
jgi:uncharacterized membrane protein